MHRHLFAGVDIRANRAHVLDGTVPEAFVDEHCAAYERWITSDGGIDLQLLGIGRNGHIAFNEPAEMDLESALKLPTRKVALHPTTRADASKNFGGKPESVPTHALTMGIATILSARAIVVLAFGHSKADAVYKALCEPPTMLLPASLLQTVRPRVTWILDEAAWEKGSGTLW
jgi:glucosamine-6-phosphate deaminase